MRGRLFLGTSGSVYPHWRRRFYPASRPARPVTASFVYVRRHGSSGRYQGAYPEAALQADAPRIHRWPAEGLDVYVSFNNDGGDAAVRNAHRLTEPSGP